jgi:hypothetical protein
MDKVDIMDAVQQGVEIMLFKTWRHKGYIDGFTSDSVVFVVDDKKYKLDLKETDWE